MDRLEQVFSDLGIDVSSIPRASDFKAGQNTFKDGDTLQTSSGENIRLKGIDTAETTKVDFSKGLIKGDQPGADTQALLTSQIARENNYTVPVLSNTKDKYDRQLGDLQDEYGNKLSNKLLELGYANLASDANQEQINSLNYGRLNRINRELNGNKTEADLLLDKLNNERNAFGLKAKIYTPDAKSYGASLDANGNSDYFIGPSIVRQGESRTGFAVSNLSTGWDIGMAQMQQGWFGAIDMLGTKTGAQFLEDYGKSNVRALKSELEDLPYLRNAEAFDEKGEWKLDTLGKMLDFTVGTVASSAPQMIASIVAAFASPATYGLSMTIPSAIYAGQVWNNQESKNATAALLSGITQGVLDKLGVESLFAKGLNITEKSTQKLVTDQLVKQGMTKEAAEKLIITETKEAIKQVSDAAKIVAARNQLSATNIGKHIVTGAVTEGVTEGLQELAAYYGEKASFDLPIDPEEQAKLKNRILNNVAGGFILGGALTTGQKVLQRATFSEEAVNRSTDVEYRSTLDKVPYTSEIIKEALNNNADVSLDKLAELESTKRMIEGVPAKLGSWWQDKGFRSLWGTWSGTIMGDRTYRNKYMAALSTLLGNGNPINGESIFTHQALLEANIQKNFGTKGEFESAFGMSSKDASILLSNPKVIEYMNKLIRAKKDIFADDISDVLDKFDTDKELGNLAKYKEPIANYANKIDKLINDYNLATNEEYSFDDFISRKPLDKSLVSRYSKDFTNDIKEALGLTAAEAQEVTNAILNNNSVNNVEDVLDELLNFDATKFKDKTVLESKLNEPENKNKFYKYMSHDLVDNAFTISARAAAKNTNTNLIGKDGNKLAALIQAGLNSGNITEQEASFMAKEIKDFLDMRAGKYHSIDNPYIKGALNTVNFLTTIISLPLAAVSSTVEFAQVFRNLNKPQSAKALKSLVKDFGSELSGIFQEIGTMTTGKIRNSPTQFRVDLAEAGFLHEGNIAHRNDVMSGYFQKWTEGFFKLTGLNSVTAITRHAKLAIAADAINNWVNTIRGGNPNSQEVIDAKEHLVRLGIDVDFMLSVANANEHNPDIEKRVFDNLQRGSYNFVNEAVVQPNYLNRPKFYSDPYLRLVTQFQGYTSAFTANVLPRLLGDLRKQGSADQGNAAATIAMMFALSIIALYIKDMIKYGESPPKWLKKDKEFQRVINQMGILGSGQRVWDAVSDITGNDKYTKSVLGNISEQITNQSPQIAFVNKINSALSAPEGKGIERGARLLPIFGTSPAFAKYLQKELGEK